MAKSDGSLTVREFMVTAIVSVKPDTEIMDAMRELVDKQISGAPVVDGQGNLVGMLTERDCIGQALTAGYHGEAAGRVAEFMSGEIESVDVNTALMDIAKRFTESRYRRFPVMDNNHLVGIISRRDVLRAILKRQ